MTFPLNFLPAANSRIAVVGGCGGMGQALVNAASDHGLRVASLDLQRSIDDCKLPGGVLALPCDVSDDASVAAAFRALREEWQGLDTLVNLAGYTGEQILVKDLPTAEWDAINDCCLRGMFLVTQHALPLLEMGENPSIVLTSSTFGHRVVHPGYAAYAAAKAGVVSLGKALATECAPRVRVNVISPGVFRTAFLDGGTGRSRRQTGIDMDKYPQIVPLKRLGEPAEIVGPILFLAGPSASYITGQVLHVNGGIWAP
ncbi:3-oxoacyl-[acyl-carrier-protein] reductase FabG [Cupriavidus sp. TKC]|uniref:SDR family NAD(P)-dependent oxidoreductase n=1 Tax=Cupriavidus sp. TKC TaxID=2880159 RepID=UPI0025A82665|nr:SDR family oxidoreductase [Cupriavidus sp. TKC]GMG90513.1 3-oxoacyl-[acyl-carrier-protein] reductase FabG [Cupriavidus sp. TKC]